jgi:hypothetical protein
MIGEVLDNYEIYLHQLTPNAIVRLSIRDVNGYSKPETRWVFTPFGYGFGSNFIPMSLLMGINLYPASLWVRVCSYNTQTREPMGFLNPIKPSAYCHFIL